MRMKLFAAAGLALALASTPAFAGRHHTTSPWGDGSGWDGDGGFAAATLSGTYIFEATGFASGPGQVSMLGTLTFDGVSAVTGNLIVTAADGGQFSCGDTFTTGGSYTVTSSSTAPGLGTIVLPVTSGTINFDLLIPRSEGKNADVIESDNGTLSVTVCGKSVTTLVLKGHLKALPACD